ncbi:hypothetical protein [Maricaulis sp. MIT060901]|uniref:hypothetical protein n=1 Tax=Maricaulis sp. MIT060901 TaxID=3096993 RepID=UPI003999C43C
MLSHVRIEADLRWRMCLGFATFSFAGAFAWGIPNATHALGIELTGPMPSGYALRFASTAAHGILGTLAAVVYVIAYVPLLCRSALFLPVYATASASRFVFWLSQISDVNFPVNIGFFMMAVDLAVIFTASKWYLRTLR